MNWANVQALLKIEWLGSWLKKRTFSELLLIVLGLFAGHFVINVSPQQQEANRQAWSESKAASEKTLADALEKQEAQQTKQTERVSASFDKAAETFKESHKEALDLFREMRRAAADQSDANIGSVYTSETGSGPAANP